LKALCALFHCDRQTLIYPICVLVLITAIFVWIGTAAQGFAPSDSSPKTIEQQVERIYHELREHDETEEKRWRSIATQIETLRRQITPRGAK